MTVYLVRHADAASRHKWAGDDALRPLTKKGLRQAAGIAARLRAEPVTRILSSPAVRCVATVQPLADALRLDIGVTDSLREGAPLASAWALLTEVSDDDSVLCAHGDLIPDLVEMVVRRGGASDPPAWAKGSTWALDWDGDRFSSARYLPPPSD